MAVDWLRSVQFVVDETGQKKAVQLDMATWHKILAALENVSEPVGSTDETGAAALLAYAGTWAGNDLEERLAELYDSRLEAKF